MEGFIETFHIDWRLMLAQVINFGLVFAVFYLLAAKPLGKLIKDRGQEIETGLSDAKTNAEMLRSTKEEYEKMLLKARTEADEIAKSVKQETAKERAEMIEQTKAEVAAMIASGKKTLENDKNKIVVDAKNEIVLLTIQATEKLIGRKIDGSVDKKNVEELGHIKK